MNLRQRIRAWLALALLLALVSLAAGADLLLSQLHGVAQEILTQPLANSAELLRSHYRATQAALWLGALGVAAGGPAPGPGPGA